MTIVEGRGREKFSDALRADVPITSLTIAIVRKIQCIGVIFCVERILNSDCAATSWMIADFDVRSYEKVFKKRRRKSEKEELLKIRENL